MLPLSTLPPPPPPPQKPSSAAYPSAAPSISLAIALLSHLSFNCSSTHDASSSPQFQPSVFASAPSFPFSLSSPILISNSLTLPLPFSTTSHASLAALSASSKFPLSGLSPHSTPPPPRRNCHFHKRQSPVPLHSSFPANLLAKSLSAHPFRASNHC